MPPRFHKILEAFGHEPVAVRDTDLAAAPDIELVRAVSSGAYDLLLSLDAHREAHVWSELLPELAEGRGRLLRIRLGPREPPTIAALTYHWARPYALLEPMLADSRLRMIQIGRSFGSNQRLKGGIRAYTAAQVAALVQQSMTVAPDNSLRAPGSPRLRQS